MTKREEVIARWLARREEMSRFKAAVDGATLCENVLADLEEIERAEGSESLDLRDAAAISGYSVDHLGRLLRDGSIPNAGRKGAPRILRRDVPRRARRALPHGPPDAYDPAADARSLMSRRNGGANGDSSSEA